MLTSHLPKPPRNASPYPQNLPKNNLQKTNEHLTPSASHRVQNLLTITLIAILETMRNDHLIKKHDHLRQKQMIICSKTPPSTPHKKSVQICIICGPSLPLAKKAAHLAPSQEPHSTTPETTPTSISANRGK